MTDEYIRLMRAAWTTDPVTLRGQATARSANIHVLPKPVQRPAASPSGSAATPTPPSAAPAALGDGWHPIGMRPPALLLPDEYAAKVKQLHDCGPTGRTRPARRSP